MTDKEDPYSFSGGTAANLEGWFQLLGFQAEKPFYEYYAPDGPLLLRLWYDEESGVGLGIRYRDDRPRGFGFTTTGWAERDPEREKEGFGWYRWEEPLVLPSPPDYILENWKYWEREEYDGKGWLLGRTSYTDCSDYSGSEDKVVYSIGIIYDEKGCLVQRNLGRNSFLCGTTNPSVRGYFDSRGRLAYEYGYITHGSTDTYYIYEGEATKPSYALYLDDNLEADFPQFVRYR